MPKQTLQQKRRQAKLTQAVYQTHPANLESTAEVSRVVDRIPAWLVDALWSPRTAVATICLLLAVAALKVTLVGGSFWPQFGQSVAAEANYLDEGATAELHLSTASEQASSEATKAEELKIEVYVSGAVKQPGVYELPESARVHHAVAAAGGLIPEAEASAVNLASKLTDEAHLHVPTRGENPKLNDNALSDSKNEKRGLLRLNTASATELQNLPGIGPVLAQRIVDYRDEKGPFQKVSDLAKVSGIGASLLAKLEGQVAL